MPVILLVHADGTNGSTSFTDVSGAGHTLTSTSATVSTTSPKFGTGSASFTAAANISVSSPADFNFGSGPFTVEAWAYYTATPAFTQVIVSQSDGFSGNTGWAFGTVSGNYLAFLYSVSGADSFNVGVTFTPTLNTWYHLAADRDASNILRVYVNGVVVASGGIAVSLFPSATPCKIGNDTSGFNDGFPGRLDEIRVIKGAAAYGGAFTPPAAPFVGAAQATQVALEQFLTSSAPAQVTQAALEHWVTTATVTGQALVTLVGLEQWASTGAIVIPPSSGAQARVMVMA